MEWVIKLIAKFTDAEGKFDAEGFQTEYGQELAKNFVPKAEFNAKNDALKAATQSLKDAEAANGDAEKIKTALAEAETARTKAEGDLAAHVKSTAIKDALTAAGGTDLDYLAYKLGEVDEKDIASKVKDLTASLPDYFPKPDAGDGKGGEQKPGGGYTPIDNKLGTGTQQTAEQAVQATLEAAMGLK